MPLDLVVKKALNSRSAFSAEIPTPQSFTVTRTWPASSSCDRIVSSRGRSDDRLHRLNTVHHQIDDHLLQLDPISENQGQRRARAPSRSDTRWLDQLKLHQGDDLVNDVIDVERCFLDAGLGRERTDALDNLARPFAVLDDPRQQIVLPFQG